MKKNGFTMAELLGVITVLAIIVLLAIPAITKNITGGKQKLYQVQLENFKKAASSWMTSHTLELPEEVIDTSITLGCLKSEGLIENSVINPLTGTEFPNDLTITIKSASNQFVYTVDENSGTDTSVPIPKGKCKFKKGLIDGVSNPTLVEVIKNADEIMTLDPDKNPRYVGRNPNNYVKFNNELWRIIGAFNGQAKIIRNEIYSTGIALNSNGCNDWSEATLKSELNGTYLNSINSIYKNMIDESHVWDLGGVSGDVDSSDLKRDDFYVKERGTEVIEGRPTEWTGAIGLIYPSDYGYSTSTTADICSKNLIDWSFDDISSSCIEQNWLYDGDDYDLAEGLWTISPRVNVEHFWIVEKFGRVYPQYPDTDDVVAKPALYLKPEVVVRGGNGSETQPFELSLS